MDKKTLELLIQRIQLQIQILQIQLRIKLLKEKLTVPNLNAPKKIILHHGGGWLDFKGVNNYHKGLWGFRSSLGFYAGYQYFIERDGNVYQARADNEEGAHTRGFNKQTIGICLMGNGEEKDFTAQQYRALLTLVNKKMLEYNLTKKDLFTHKNFSATLCPSFRLDKWVANY